MIDFLAPLTTIITIILSKIGLLSITNPHKNETFAEYIPLPGLQIQEVVLALPFLLENIKPYQLCLHQLGVIVCPPVLFNVLQHDIVHTIHCSLVLVCADLLDYLELSFVLQPHRSCFFMLVQLPLLHFPPQLSTLNYNLRVQLRLLFYCYISVGMLLSYMFAMLYQIVGLFAAQQALDYDIAVALLPDGGIVRDIYMFLEVMVLELTVTDLAWHYVLGDEYIVWIMIYNWCFLTQFAATRLVPHILNIILTKQQQTTKTKIICIVHNLVRLHRFFVCQMEQLQLFSLSLWQLKRFHLSSLKVISYPRVVEPQIGSAKF